MLKHLEKTMTTMAFAAVAGIALQGCGKSESGARFTPVGAEQEVRGMVADARLTACGPTPEKPGTCEGTLVVGPQGSGAAVSVEVTRDVVPKKDGQAVFLPQLRGSQVIVKYRATKEGAMLATSVVSQ